MNFGDIIAATTFNGKLLIIVGISFHMNLWTQFQFDFMSDHCRLYNAGPQFINYRPRGISIKRAHNVQSNLRSCATKTRVIVRDSQLVRRVCWPLTQPQHKNGHLAEDYM